MWNNHNLWNNHTLWNNHNLWNSPKDVEKATGVGTKERSAILVRAAAYAKLFLEMLGKRFLEFLGKPFPRILRKAFF